jgi:hypothetical protein
MICPKLLGCLEDYVILWISLFTPQLYSVNCHG